MICNNFPQLDISACFHGWNGLTEQQVSAFHLMKDSYLSEILNEYFHIESLSYSGYNSEFTSTGKSIPYQSVLAYEHGYKFNPLPPVNCRLEFRMHPLSNVTRYYCFTDHAHVVWDLPLNKARSIIIEYE